MVQIHSVTGDKEGYRAMASLLSEEMDSLGFRPEWMAVEEGKPNVVGTMNFGNHPVLLLNGHIDVVPADSRDWETDPFKGELKEDRFFGRGACDMKGGLAAMLMGARIFLESKPKLKGSLLLTATVDEEIGGFDGLKYLMDQNVRADFGIICEPTELEIVNVSKGLVWVGLKTQGKEAHGSMPERGVNAIAKMAKILEKLEEVPLFSEKHKILGQGTVNTGVIHGGTRPNIVPGMCEAQIDVRYLPGQSAQEVIKRIEGIIEKLRAGDPDLQAKAELIRYRSPVEISEDSEIVRRISKAAEEVTGERPKLRGMVSPADLEHLCHADIPSVMFGPGSDCLAHEANEWISIDSILAGSLIYAMLMKGILT
jgi:acetylornithine deacetylase/succinyl-diaminopimelate desuccinylase family protein